MVSKSVENGDYEGFNINGKCFVNILQFADDTLMVRNGSWKHIWAIKAVLMRGFELVVGLGINFHKSNLIGVNINSHFLEIATGFLSCRKEEKEFIFLEIPIGYNSRRISMWKGILTKMKNRLWCWKGRMLSFRGRLTFLKSMLFGEF
ncbi:uncharacterized protein LOC131660095 [Vicia villosa]|uniref:uncharacterized protein LOC131632903 n=1 Tax=Vicia villosa TaxID=3911 RepID=UPI00273AF0F7|nr:uncharacterized protein LOC131632903 [Vicia villosa]XP_058785217.1 uncharacterized protein LOC131660095 [Vicia villosa]